MQKTQSANHTRLQNWLQYTPLLYKCLAFNIAPDLKTINTVKYLRGAVSNKSFKYHQGFVCIAGASAKSFKGVNNQGGLAVYKYSIPVQEEMDTEAVRTSIKLRGFCPFREEVEIMEQYGNNLADKEKNNMFAITFKSSPLVHLISTRKLLQEGMRPSYAQNDSAKLEGHKLPITSIKWANFPSKGHRLLTTSQDSTIMEWDIQKIKLDRHLKYHRDSVHGICPLYNSYYVWNQGCPIANQTRALASISNDGTIYIWDNKNPTPVNKIMTKSKELTTIDCISQHCFIAGGVDGSIKLWDLRNSRDYLYENKLDKVHGHQGRIRQIKVKKRAQVQKNSNNDKNKNNLIGDIKFTTSGDDGKIINWEQKLQFVHEGHQTEAVFDMIDESELFVSAETKKNIFMIWQPGVCIGNQH